MVQVKGISPTPTSLSQYPPFGGPYRPQRVPTVGISPAMSSQPTAGPLLVPLVDEPLPIAVHTRAEERSAALRTRPRSYP
jgi:hypothetical protein